MKSVSKDLSAHLALPVTNLTTCWRMRLADGTVQGWTSHDTSLTIDNVLYEPSAVGETDTQMTTSIEVTTSEFKILIDDNDARINTILQKKYDKAKIDAFQVDYTNPPNEVTTSSVLWVKSGIVGDVDIEDGVATVEIRSQMDLLTQKTAIKTSRLCRAEFGDENCKVDLSLHSVETTITSHSNNIATVSSTLNTGDYEKGRLVFTDRGISYDIYSNVNSNLELTENIEFDATNENVTVIKGCGKWVTDCRGYGNMPNYFGEPYIPDEDEWNAGYFDTVSL